MGSKQTKLEGEYLPQTPQYPPNKPITVETNFGHELEDILDPRSPHICRTPLNEIVQKTEKSYQQKAAISTEQPFSLLRKRFFKGFSYSLNDPRSPSVLNRTPIVFDETVNLNDTFSDLFADIKAPRDEIDMKEYDEAAKLENKETPAIVKEQEEMAEEEEKTEIEEVATPKITKTQPQEIEIERDPRSPSIGVERTPIILNDDDAPDEEDMIETILSTLSLNTKMPANKPLDRIRNKKTKTSKSTPGSSAAANRKELTIYQDRENMTPTKAPRGAMDSPLATGKRTPLSCVKNNPQFKSKSVEISGKTLKARLPLTSFDDTIHKITPVKKILRYSNMENIENSFEF